MKRIRHITATITLAAAALTGAALTTAAAGTTVQADTTWGTPSTGIGDTPSPTPAGDGVNTTITPMDTTWG